MNYIMSTDTYVEVKSWNNTQKIHKYHNPELLALKIIENNPDL